MFCWHNSKAGRYARGTSLTVALTVGVLLLASGCDGLFTERVLLHDVLSKIVLRSDYFREDSVARQIALGDTVVTVPELLTSPDRGIGWRLLNGFQLAGTEAPGVPWGAEFSQSDMLRLDREVRQAEKFIVQQAAKLPDYRDISGPDFQDNLPQRFAAHLFASVFDLFNVGPVQYEPYTNECLLASLYPQMRGALVDLGGPTTSPELPFTVQTPELFGFNNVRRRIGADEYPVIAFSSTFAYAATAVHEFVHDIDVRSQADGSVQAAYSRDQYCGGQYMDFSQSVGGSPSPFDVAMNIDDAANSLSNYVSSYAYDTGPSYQENFRDYRPWEDAAESVTAFLLVPEYFRQRASSSDLLARKYAYIRDELFGGIEFETDYLSNGTTYDAPDKIGEFVTLNEISRFSFEMIRSRTVPG